MATKVYTTRAGDTLLSIATVQTLSPAYWEAIATFNGFVGEQASPGYRFAAGEKVGIPEEWLLPTAIRQLAPLPGTPLDITVTGAGGQATGAPATAAQGIPWGYVALGVGALLLVAALTQRR